MSEKLYDVSADWAKRALVDDAKYREMYARSVADPNAFWAEQGKRIDWIKPFHKVENASFAPGNISIKWFEDGVLNVAWNCIDRHLEKRGDQTAIIWEATIPMSPNTSPTASCMTKSARWPTSCAHGTSGRATASPSICR